MNTRIMAAVAAVAASAAIPLAAFADLPSGYHRLDYITANGSEYFDTGYTPALTDRVEIRASVIDVSQSRGVFCSRNASAKESFSVLSTKSGMRFDLNDAQQTVGFVAQSGEPFTVALDGNAQKCYVNGDLLHTFSVSDFTPGARMYIFALHKNGSDFSAMPKGNIYWFKAYAADGVTLKSDIVPAYGWAEQAVGLYDRVAGKFLTAKAGTPVGGPYTLSADEDWSDADALFPDDTTVDLAGHCLTVATAAKNAASTVAGAGYQDIDFVSATGAQGILIPEFRLPGTAKVEVKFRPGVISGSQWLFLSRTAGAENTYSVLLNNTGNLRFDFNNKQVTGNVVLSAGKDYELVFDGSSAKPKWYINGTEEKAHTATSNDFTSGSDPILFGSSVSGGTKCRLYRFKVTSGDEVLLDLHPVRRISDGVAGLYDSVAPAFYPSSSATAFPGLATPKFSNTSATVSELRVGQELIEGYTLVDCITASDSQYIDTGFVPVSTDRIEIKASIASGSSNRGLFCSRDSNAKNALNAIYDVNGDLRFDFNANDQNTTTFSPGDDTIFTVALDGNTQKCYGNGELLHTFNVGNDFTPSANLFIFALHKAGESVGYHPSGSIYSFKVTGADGALKLDMVPVVRASDGAAGLFDRVNRKFFPSSGAKAFTAGTQAGDGKLYVDKDSAFDATEIAGNVTLVKNGNGAFYGCGTTIAGMLKPTAGTVGGVMLQNGATLDLSALSAPLSLDDNAISFADNASITIDLKSRTAPRKMPLVSWTTPPANLGTLKFVRVAGAACEFAVKADGIYAVSGLIISVH